MRIPQPLAQGKPSTNYPWPWSIYRWIPGESANTKHLEDICLSQIALGLAQFLNELHKISSPEGPKPGPHNFWRGACPSVYDLETRAALAQLQAYIDVEGATSVWNRALCSSWDKNPVWIHGDFAGGNILLKENRLAAVIDFGCMGIGDPACDLTIAWTLFKGPSRKLFQSHVNVDPKTWERARGLALWKALITLTSLHNKNNAEALKQKKIIEEILKEHQT